MKYYTGIGSRETPEDVLGLMEYYALHLAYRGWVLRSGCAPGADTAFEQGAFDARFARREIAKPELYLPWPNFEGRRKSLVRLESPTDEAIIEAAKHHPAWERLSQGAQKLHARNVHQVLGPDVLNPVLSKFVLCWTKGASGSGGTGQALRIAKHYGVPAFDLADPVVRRRIEASLAA